MAIVKISVFDQDMKAIENANVALTNSFDGVIVGSKTDKNGVAVLVTTNKFWIGLKVSYVGFETNRPDISKGLPSYVQLKQNAEPLDEVTINNKKPKKINWLLWGFLAVGAGVLIFGNKKTNIKTGSKTGLKAISKPRKIQL